MTGMLTAAMIPSIISGIAHASNATRGPNVRRDPLERHDGTCPGILGDLGVLGCDDVHDDAALEHLGEAFLGGPGGGLGGHWQIQSLASAGMRGVLRRGGPPTRGLYRPAPDRLRDVDRAAERPGADRPQAGRAAHPTGCDRRSVSS